jgi:peptide/nickel transport system ATP-binding protein
MTDPLLEIRGLGKTFDPDGRQVVALADVDLDIAHGECHAVVGESGSGKSTLANLILGIYQPTAGAMRLDGAPLPPRRAIEHRRRIQLVQQNPLSSLNPRRKVGASIRLPLDVHHIGDRAQRRLRVEELLVEVGLEPEMARRSPASLSGGQRQRVAIARALAARPELIVLDEPTSALDVLVQARVLALLDRLRREHGLTYVFITHDLAVVRALADRISVFAQGRKVESGTVAEIFDNPQQTFTRELLAAAPVVTEEEAALREVVRAELREAQVSRSPTAPPATARSEPMEMADAAARKEEIE